MGAKTPTVQKEIVQIKVRSKNEKVFLVSAGDFHIGATSFNEAAFFKFIEHLWALTQIGQVYLLLMGDIFDSINVNDKRFNLAEHDKSMDDSQVFMAKAMARLHGNPNFHVVGSLTGNHELKYCRGDSDPIFRLYQATGIKPLGMKCYIYFDFILKGKKTATLRTVAFHGCSNSRLPQGRTRIVREFLKENQLTEDEFIRLNQIAFYGHTHDCKVEEVKSYVPNVRAGTTAEYTQYACLTGSFYDIANFNTSSYAAEHGYTPSPVGYVCVTATLDTDLRVETVTNHGLNPNVEHRSWGKF